MIRYYIKELTNKNNYTMTTTLTAIIIVTLPMLIILEGIVTSDSRLDTPNI